MVLLGKRRGVDLHVAGKGLSSRVSCFIVNLVFLGEEKNDAAPLHSLATTPVMV